VHLLGAKGPATWTEVRTRLLPSSRVSHCKAHMYHAARVSRRIHVL
jgi:hypothetical protein